VARRVPLTTASDAHHLDHVAHRADDLRALLASVGVGELRGYRARAPHVVPVTTPPAGSGRLAAERSEA